MHLLYLDESGSAVGSSQRYFVLAGVCAFERATHWIEQKLDGVAERFEPGNGQFDSEGGFKRALQDFPALEQATAPEASFEPAALLQ